MYIGDWCFCLVFLFDFSDLHMHCSHPFYLLHQHSYHKCINCPDKNIRVEQNVKCQICISRRYAMKSNNAIHFLCIWCMVYPIIFITWIYSLLITVLIGFISSQLMHSANWYDSCIAKSKNNITNWIAFSYVVELCHKFTRASQITWVNLCQNSEPGLVFVTGSIHNYAFCFMNICDIISIAILLK